MKSKYLLVVFLSVMLFGCEKLVEVSSPTTSITDASVYENDATAIAVLTRIYSTISNVSNTSVSFSILSLSLYAGLGADELFVWDGVANSTNLYQIMQYRFFRNDLIENSNFQSGGALWTPCYQLIYYCNQAIERIGASTSLTPAVAQQLLGEAKFSRALCNFYLVNCFGGLPLVTNTDYQNNALLAKSSSETIYKQVKTDLKEAYTLLSADYLDATLLTSSSERVRPTKWAAAALLARVSLYTSDWADAETYASEVIAQNALFDTVALDNVFLKNSKETIWALQPVITGWNTQDALNFIIPATGFSLSTNNTMYINPDLLNSFSDDDGRKSHWLNKTNISGTDYYYPYKYKSATQNAAVTEYPMMMRLGEQYLIRAEARAMLGKLSGDNSAASDLNVIRRRAGLASTDATTQTSLMTAIQHERRLELFTELGHRWFDLKRWSIIDQVMTVMTPIKADGQSWQTYQQLYPIPNSNIEADPNLEQNTGY
ncbi:Starch-binding associating with outer membrane [bacterium A37T11]|nr:Starch-binding associating with outer membrane [bacterium A37T11]